MNPAHYKEMTDNLNGILKNPDVESRHFYLFGHCEATLTLADHLLDMTIVPEAILDNNSEKYSLKYKDIPVISPDEVLKSDSSSTTVLIVSRFYESMYSQLRKLGFNGDIVKLIDFNTYAEYSLYDSVQQKKLARVKEGIKTLDLLKEKYPDSFYIFCPFNALGDIYFCMSYLPAYLNMRKKHNPVVCVPSNSCASVVRLFDNATAEVMDQNTLDATIQAVIYTQDGNCFIAHQDRPYVINLHKALKTNLIPLETIYCCGIFGLPKETPSIEPVHWEAWPELDIIQKNRAVILSPYAKSVPPLAQHIWNDIILEYVDKGYQVFTNVVGVEEPLPGTMPLNALISEMKSVLEKAGTFIGIRSGLCDVLKTANCHKIALYPDYNYSDTKWKAIDMYSIDGFENIAVNEDFRWKKK